MEAYSKKYNYLIKWNAKSGCTIFRQLFLELHKDELITYPLNKWHELGKHFPKNNITKCYKIHLVRNPYMRVVSMFTNKYCGGQVAILKTKIKLEKVTFYNFVKYLLKCSKNNDWCDVHIFPQNLSYEKNDKIIKLENFENDILESYSHEKTKLLLPKVHDFLQKLNKNKMETNKTDKNYENTEFVGMKEYDENYTGTWSDYKYFYNKEIANMVYETYKNDFITYGYSSVLNF
jgi:hypothetical protein